MISSTSFLSFEDWLSKNEHQRRDWIVVALKRKISSSSQEKVEDYLTYSALVPNKKGISSRLVNDDDWKIELTLGMPGIQETWQNGRTTFTYERGLSSIIDGVEYRPFVYYRSFHQYFPTVMELSTEFILHYNLYYVTEASEYRRIDDTGTVHTVAKIERDNENIKILVDTHDLRTYLAATKCLLVRFHDFIRFDKEEIEEASVESLKRHIVQDPERYYSLYLEPNFSSHERNLGKLHGKDLILPYNKRLSKIIREGDERKFVKFIVSRDEEGRIKEQACNAEYSRGFLTPIFFRSQVLAKYLAEPSKFTVDERNLWCLGLWTLPIDQIEDTVIQVWLGDLGRIPYSEQVHWRQYNISRPVDLSSYRIRQDIFAEFVEPQHNIIFNFKEAFKRIQATSQVKLGETLFKPLEPGDQHLESTLHIPHTDEWVEFDAQAQALAKITTDSFNVSLLQKLTGQKIDNDTIKGSIHLFAIYLEQNGLNEAQRTSILSSLHVIQTIRSNSSSHRKSAEFNKTLKRLQLDGLTKPNMIKKMISDLILSLDQIVAFISK